MDTKQKILDAAERLIAERGYSATSLRHIIADAGVNLAAVHYHFGSKEELLDQLVMRKLTAVNEKRLEMLERVRAESAPALPPVEGVLKAFMFPVAESASRDPRFVKVMGRILVEGLLPALIEKHFKPTAAPFFGAIRQALPDLSEQEYQWRIHFLIGAMAHTMCGHPVAEADFKTRIGYLIRFLNAGLLAPAGQPIEVTT